MISPGGQFYFDRGKIGESGIEFCVAGSVYNGSIEVVDDGIVSIGEDCLLYRPDMGLFGVFDGSGGATDVGIAKFASITAAQSIADFFSDKQLHTTEIMRLAMQTARLAVIADALAGLTTGLFVKIDMDNPYKEVHLAQCGDGMAGIYPDPEFVNFDSMEWLVPDQSNIYGDPSNILGRIPDRIRITDLDAVVGVEVDRSKDRYMLLATDGVTGNCGRDNGIDETDIEYAFAPYHSIGTITRLLIEPPIRRTLNRKRDDKSLVVVQFPGRV